MFFFKHGEFTGIKHSLLLILTFIILTCCDSETIKDIDIAYLSDSDLQIATDVFLDQAQLISEKTPVSIVDKTDVFIPAGKRNYVSLACYWWPNPDSDNGLPYQRIDGKVNPETRSQRSDLPKLIEMAKRVEILSAAFRISRDERFAKSAIRQLSVWFLNPNSSMHPHLEHAQMIKGRNTGRSYGVIDTWWLIRVVDSFQTLSQSAHWSDDIETELKTWFTHYLNWLLNSEFGQTESRSKNNHGTWYDVQIATFSDFIELDYPAKVFLNESVRSRVRQQISFTGKQKHETKRPRPAHYSIFNLNGLIRLATYVHTTQPDILQHKEFPSGSLNHALYYLTDMMNENVTAELSDPYDRTDGSLLYAELLFKAADLTGNSDFEHYAIGYVNKNLTNNPKLLVPLIKTGRYKNSAVHN